jgi:hypothetical protein
MSDPAVDSEPTTMMTTDDGATTSGDEAEPAKSGDEKPKEPRARRVRNKKGAGRGGGTTGGVVTAATAATNAPATNNKPDYWRLVKPAFREWLTNITNREEYNGLGVLERSALLRDFGVSQKGLAPAAPVVAPAKTATPAPAVVEPDKPVVSAE